MDELAAAAKQDPVAYRLALLDKSPRAKAVLAPAAEKAGWGQPLPERIGRGVSLQFVFASFMAQVAEVEVSRGGPCAAWASAGLQPSFPAVANAIFAATGKRLRKMPVDTTVLKQST